ncbi:MAG: antitoxin component YwqK of YwqJK toxin-antitoxin module, partial [Limisphaerales bacterium]
NELKKGTLFNGNGTILIYSMNGKAIEERNYSNGKLQGKKKVFNK